MKSVIPLVVLFALFTSEVANADDEVGKNPLALTKDQRAAVSKAIAADPEKLPRLIAEELSVPEAAVVEALPSEMRRSIDPSQFKEVWAQLVKWEKPLLILRVAGSVFQIRGSVAPGRDNEGYYSIDADWSPWGGHLKPSELGAIFLIQKPFRGRHTWQCAFYDKKGKRAFSIYVDGEGAVPHAETLAAFKQMWKKFEKPE